MTKPSTLQRSAMRPEKGEFEANFAVNLDFSGVDGEGNAAHETSTHVDTRTTSHSAALLQLKQAELAQKLHNEQQEAMMQEIAQKRLEKLNAIEQSRSQQDLSTFLAPAGATKRSNSRSSNASIGALVVGMHSAERNDEPKQKMLRGHARDSGPISNKRKSHGQSSSSTTRTAIRTTRHLSAKDRPRRKQGGGKKVAAPKSNHHRSKY